MVGTTEVEGIEALVRRLRLYQPPPSPYDGASTTAAGGGGELFRPRRAAVLVCLFRRRGGDGELRVILTKRSSSLSTHSGELASFLPSSSLASPSRGVVWCGGVRWAIGRECDRSDSCG
ncbi:Os08g0376200 [Oryza sativa Japonica Group]|uniref:Os08g0376200 protein n=1 Tax=Oryza sativa subsp. japonica TaxID=39947 RepID=A0A0P0XFE1_ORYSJ|nr:Os08g0376200 [Oryza sativa Japonica Group]